MTSERAVLVAGGPLGNIEARMLRADLATDPLPLVVGVDGGAEHLRGLGVVPGVVTGDFDSSTVNTREWLAARGTTLVETPDQDYTDLDKALGYVLAHRQAVRVYAATGGRLDHTFAALSTLVKYRRKSPDADIRLVDAWGETWALTSGGAATKLSGPDLPGRTLSLIALGPVAGITTTGVRWPLTNEALAPGVRDGTSNEVVAETVTVAAAEGNLLVMLHHKVTHHAVSRPGV